MMRYSKFSWAISCLILVGLLLVSISDCWANSSPGDLLLTIRNPWPAAPGWTQGFGASMAGAGDNIVVGVPYDDPNNIGNAGALYVFDSSNGTFLRKITNPKCKANNNFGGSVAALGNSVIAGSPIDYDYINGTGGLVEAGRAFRFDPTSGSALLTMHAPSPQYDAHFGSAVAAAGNDILISEPSHTLGSNITVVGAAYLLDGSTGNLIRTIPDPVLRPDDNGGYTRDYFGYSIAGSSDRILVGAPGVTLFNGTTRVGFVGSAYLIDKASGNLLAELDNPIRAANGWFGRDVEFAGNNIAVSCGGKAYLYDGTTYQIIKTLTNPNLPSDAGFAMSMARAGDNLLVNGKNSAFLFDGKTGDLLMTLSDPDSNGSFGYSVAAFGDKLLVSGQDEVYMFQSIPEPTTITLLFTATLGGLLLWRRRR